MISDIDIKDEFYRILKNSSLTKKVNGILSKTLRPSGSDAEDIVISILANGSGDIQEAYVNINIYVKDLVRGNQSEENTIRLRELSNLAIDILESGFGKNYRFTLESQRIMQVPGKSEHFINNKVLIKFSNE